MSWDDYIQALARIDSQDHQGLRDLYLWVMSDFTDLTPARQQVLAGMIAAKAQLGACIGKA